MNNETIDFETLRFNVFEMANNIVLNDLNDADAQVFGGINFDSQYFEIETFKTELKTLRNKFTALHINIRSINSNIDKLKQFLTECNYLFSMICLTETWCSDESSRINSNLEIPNYKLISSERKTNKRGGGIINYIRTDQTTKYRDDLSISDADSEIFTIEISNNKSKNILVSTCYRPPDGDLSKFSNHLKQIFYKNRNEQKKIFCIGDINIDCLQYDKQVNTKLFFDEMFQHYIFPIINKPTRVTQSSVTSIDNILTNTILDVTLKAGIIKTDISDHFQIFFSLSHDTKTTKDSKIEIHKSKINKHAIQQFKESLSAVNWDKVYQECYLGRTNTAYTNFEKIFLKSYNKHFPIKVIITKEKYLKSPWITKGIIKSSKKKQKLYIKYLKSRNEANLNAYKQYKNLFEKIKKISKKNYYSNRIKNSKGDIKKTWDVIKEIIGNKNCKPNSLPTQIVINNKEYVSNDKISEKFNSFLLT